MVGFGSVNPMNTTTTTKSRAYIALAYAISGPMNIAPPDWSI